MKKSIRQPLHLMTCALLSNQAEAIEVIDNAWEIDSGFLYYSEDERVNVGKVLVTAKGNIDDSNSVRLKTIFDTMTGATPSGAVKRTNITFTGASGGLSVSGQAPPLATFDDTRLAQSIEWEHQNKRNESYTFTGNLSVENDYRSFGAGAVYNKEFRNKTLKLTAGASGTYDEVFRVGGNDTPVPLSEVTRQQFNGEGKKTTLDAMVGLTVVVNQRTLAQFNLGTSHTQGYLTDPYKLFSIVDLNGIEYEQRYESRPTERTRYTLGATVNHQQYPGDDVFHGSYRLYVDDWGVVSHTLEVSKELQEGEGVYAMPNFRYYHQSAADFYRNAFTHDPALLTPADTVLPEFVSADYRLDQINGYSLGITYGKRGSDNSHLRFRMMFTHWRYSSSEFDTLNAVILTANYGKKF